MKSHNSNYEGLVFTVEITNNGYILVNNNVTVCGWVKKSFSTFEDLVTELAFHTGVRDIDAEE